MEIEFVTCPEHIQDKLASKHNVTFDEARQVLLARPRIRFVEHGYTEGEDVYVALGRTFSGRYLSVFFIYKPATKTAVIISARTMSDPERKAYGRK